LPPQTESNPPRGSHSNPRREFWLRWATGIWESLERHRDGPLPQKSLPEQICFSLLELHSQMALHGEEARSERFLAAARVIEALRLCLVAPDLRPAEPRRPGMASEFGKVARQLVRLAHVHGGVEDPRTASSYPRSIRECKEPATLLAMAVKFARMYGGSGRVGREISLEIAGALEMLRATGAGFGTLRVLPHDGSCEERIDLFTEVIEGLRIRTPGGTEIDPEAVVSACARACGNRRELFGALRKEVIRKARREG